jgi:hypothetical protein
MGFESTSNIDPVFDDPLEDEHISSLQLVAFSVFVILVILIPSCCCSSALVKDKRE